MLYAGIDIGSRTIELVVVNGAGESVCRLQVDTGFDPIERARKMIKEVEYDHIFATGYGRNLFEISFDVPTVTEIKAHAMGAWESFPGIHTILDIGGQDSKAIVLNGNGRVKKFEMNDRCAAGTGKFLEIMARSMDFTIDAFGREALFAENKCNISSMCTVFAESEVTSLIARGKDRRDISMGVHESVVRRAAGMINRVSSEGEVVFTGGVAKNPCMVDLLEKMLDRKVRVPEAPQYIGAMGAALLARQSVA